MYKSHVAVNMLINKLLIAYKRIAYLGLGVEKHQPAATKTEENQTQTHYN